ncbi:MAG TPA: TAT-variant-translocated molybdopterin oxidoreductase [Bryobacteraceae bacterium]|jgi:molybdopterin-containing oxidoreductase family iron-sulfur binding subunit
MSLVSIKTAAPTGPKYWRSLDELAKTPQFREFVEQEFPAHADEMLEGNSRRTVLKLMAASFGLAGLAACRRPVEHIYPTAKGWDNYVPGEKLTYATAVSLAGQVTGLLVETHDGRPTKIEGNPDHPFSQGAATALVQASLLNLYDPDRSKSVLEAGKETSWSAFEATVKSLSLGDGSGLRFLSETVASPSLFALRADVLKKFPKAKWVEYEAFQRNAGRAGAMIAFNEAVSPQTDFSKAKVIVALDSDFLGQDWQTPLPTKQFSSRRHMDSEEDFDKINRLYSVESQFSITGANADHRLRLRGSEIKQFAADLAAALGALPGLNVLNNGTDRRSKFLAAIVKDLKAAGKDSLVITSPRQPAIVHALAFLINQSLGSTAMEFAKSGTQERVEAGVDALKALVGEMNAGQVSTLVMLGGNPVYTAPADLAFASALAKVAASLHLGPDEDETAASAKWHVPEAHYLESWGDAVTSTGVATIQQPMIDPIFGGRTAAEILALVSGSPTTKAHDIVKNYWMSTFPGSHPGETKSVASGKDAVKEITANPAEQAWRKSVHDGIVSGTKPQETAKVTADAKRIAAAWATEPKAAEGGIEVAFVPSASVFDGRFANNGWMQEAPDPINKVVWGNAALISPATAKAKNLSDGDVVTLTRGGLKMEVSVLTQPGQADNAITIALGYGRERCGRAGKDVGFNANLLRSSDAFWYAPNVEIATTGKTYTHVTTQERGLADGMNNRPLYREVDIAEYKKNPKAIEEQSEVPPLHSIYTELNYDKGYQWGMAIDLGSCTGCNACVVACVAENNTPVVGKDQVARGREMHWIRMDRYYVGSEDEPRAVEQPLPCMQCENAPCENVCPVAATTHTPEGLNDMVYNRCVGTRYCANNCPFKVRHFNFLNFHKGDSDILSMVHNPDVTVRMRGVMEKCTYCVQRIQETRIAAKADGRREIKDGEIKTACQQTCPADAIVFGNINDPQSKVSKLKKQERNYAMLAELDIRPRTTYLARLRNPNPELEA